jgi:hypothetical protein
MGLQSLVFKSLYGKASFFRFKVKFLCNALLVLLLISPIEVERYGCKHCACDGCGCIVISLSSVRFDFSFLFSGIFSSLVLGQLLMGLSTLLNSSASESLLL